jgi:hypothetical protein
VLGFFEWNDAFAPLAGDNRSDVELQLLYDGRAFNTTTITNPAAGSSTYREFHLVHDVPSYIAPSYYKNDHAYLDGLGANPSRVSNHGGREPHIQSPMKDAQINVVLHQQQL